MKRFEVSGRSVSLHAGIITLTPKQAAARRHLLKDTPVQDVYDIISPVMFKCGEVFGFDGELNPASAIALVDEETKEPVKVTTRSAAKEKPSKPSKAGKNNKSKASGKTNHTKPSPEEAAEETASASGNEDEERAATTAQLGADLNA